MNISDILDNGRVYPLLVLLKIGFAVRHKQVQKETIRDYLTEQDKPL
ncbi:MAG: hypothetical protein WCB31_06440 [Nitrososphaeraceae archaeon]